MTMASRSILSLLSDSISLMMGLKYGTSWCVCKQLNGRWTGVLQGTHILGLGLLVLREKLV
jgi:hypothetical protein